MGTSVREKGPQGAESSFHLDKRAPLFELDKIPCPAPRHWIDPKRKERIEGIRLYWQEGGEELKRKIATEDQWEEFLQKESFAFTLEKIQQIIGEDPQIIRRFIKDLDLGRKSGEIGYEFDRLGLVQLLITISAYKKCRQTEPKNIQLSPGLANLLGVKRVPFGFAIPGSEERRGIFKKVRERWESGGLSFQRTEETSNPLRVFLTGIDWKKETIPLTLRQIHTGIRGNYQDLKLLRSTLQIGTKNERESSPQKTVYDFTKMELLQLIVASFAIRESALV